MGVQTVERFVLSKSFDLQDGLVAPCIARNAKAGLESPTLRLPGGQELILDPEKAGPGGWSVRAGADGTKVFTRSLEGWTYNVIPPD